MRLAESVRPAAHVSLWFRDPEESAGRSRTGRTDKRTFTVRWLDMARETMTVDFVLHGSGPASTWAATASVGDVIWTGGTRGGYDPPPPGSHLVLVGDDTAIPAMGAIAEATDPTVGITAIVEVVDGNDERPLTGTRDLDPVWLHRGEDPAQTGARTLTLLESIEVPADAHWWIAGERRAILAMRDLLRRDRHVPPDRYTLNAHWRLAPTDPRRPR